MTKGRVFVFAILVHVILFASCKKDSLEPTIEAATDYALADGIINDIFNIVDDAAKNEPQVLRNETGLSVAFGCYNASLEVTPPDTFPKKLVIDFGPVNCLGIDGRKRRGIINASFNGRYSLASSKVTITFNSYFVNDNRISGTMSIINTGLNSGGNTVYRNEIQDLIIQPSTSEVIRCSGSVTREWVSGSGSATTVDDIHLLTGNIKGSARNGNTFSGSVISAVVSDYSCRSFVTGTTDLVIGNNVQSLLDYGAGVCDDKGTLKIEKRQYLILLF